jgi:uroporphyrinogen decarboxylase
MLKERRTFLDALLLSNTSKTIPVWLMRQAGRYMQSYKDLRKKYSFEEICFIPELCVEASLQPIRAFDLDAAILFSDILFPLRVLGVDVKFSDNGPTLTPPDREITLPKTYNEDVSTLFQPLYLSAKILKETLNRPLIGFAGAPFTLAAFLLEGKGGTDLSITKKVMFHNPKRLLALTPILEEIVISHLQLQIEAGCQAIQIFDSLNHIVPSHLVQPLIVQPLQRILSRLPPCPTIYYKATKELLSELPRCPLSLDANVNLDSLAKNHERALQGNLNPAFLQLPPQEISSEIRKICTLMKDHPGFIFNLSAGVPPNTSEDVIRLLVNTVHNIDRF